MHADRADRARAFAQQLFPRNTRKELQRRLGLTDATAHRVILGRASDETIARMASKLGDDFILFVYGKRPLPALAPESHYWITSEAVTEATAGHDTAARIYLGRSSAPEVGFADIALRNLGWVAVTLSGHTGAVNFHANADPGALARAKLWLHELAGVLHAVSVNGQGRDVSSALAELERRAIAGSIKDAANQGWRIERDSLDRIDASNLALFVKARKQRGKAPGTLPALLRQTGLLPYSAIFHRDRAGEIRTLHTGEKLGIDPVEALGKRLADRADRRYAGLLQARLDTARVETTFHRLGLETAGHWWDYESVADADAPDRTGAQILCAVVNIKSKAAA